MKQIRFLILFMVTLISTMTYAQNTSYSGTVVDAQNEPIIGASVVQKGTSQGSVTDLDGKFTVSVAPGSTLVISYIGYVPQEVKAANDMRIVLKEDNKTLNEVIVVGYGVQKKSVVTAAIAKVSSEDLAGKAPVRVDNALKGLTTSLMAGRARGKSAI
jgi:hypothetical protein